MVCALFGRPWKPWNTADYLSFEAHINFTPPAGGGVPATPASYVTDTGAGYPHAVTQSNSTFNEGWKLNGTGTTNTYTGSAKLQGTSGPKADARYMTWIGMSGKSGQTIKTYSWTLGTRTPSSYNTLTAGAYSVHLVVGSPSTTNATYSGTIATQSSTQTWTAQQSTGVQWIDINLVANVGSDGFLVINDPGNVDDRLCFIEVWAVPIAPTSLSATLSGQGATLSWTDNSDNEAGFVVDRATNSAFTQGLNSFSAPAHSGSNPATYTDSGSLGRAGFGSY